MTLSLKRFQYLYIEFISQEGVPNNYDHTESGLLSVSTIALATQTKTLQKLGNNGHLHSVARRSLIREKIILLSQ